jgi:hypothetical protein
MSEDLTKAFIEQDCDEHVRSILLEEIMATGLVNDRVREWTFNRFNVSLDFGKGTAQIEDELNPTPQGSAVLPISELRALLEDNDGAKPPRG